MRHHDPGNLYIQFEVVFPESRPGLSPGELKTLKMITGPKTTDPKTTGPKTTSPKLKPETNGDAQAKKAPKEDRMDIDSKGPEDEEVTKAKEEKKKVEEKEERDEHWEDPPHDKQDPAFPNDPKRRLLTTVEDQYLEIVDQRSQDRANVATMDDDDEDGMPSGGERVQCASQ